MLRVRGQAQGTVGYLGGVPVDPHWLRDYNDMGTYNAEVYGPGVIAELDSKITYHAEARNELARTFSGDWLLQLDTDHTFECDLLQRLLRTFQTYKLDVLCGFYQRKVWPFLPQIYQWVDDGTPGSETLRPVVKVSNKAAVYQVGAAGAGCLLVRRSVFERIRAELGEEPFDPRPARVVVDPVSGEHRFQGSWSEDLGFFIRLRKLGIKAFCDLRIQYRHLRTVPVSLDDFDPSACPIGMQHETMEAF